MLQRAYRLSSTWKVFTNVCEILKTTFTHLRYPTNLINAAIKRFMNNQAIDSRSSQSKGNCSKNDEPIIITLPFKDQRSADGTRKQLQSLGNKAGIRLQPVFLSQKVGSVLRPKEPKPKIISQQCVVYSFQCGLCDMEYVGYTNQHLSTPTCCRTYSF